MYCAIIHSWSRAITIYRRRRLKSGQSDWLKNTLHKTARQPLLTTLFHGQIVTQEEQLQAMHAQEAAVQQAARESEARKQALKMKLQKQPGAEAAAGTADPELEGPDQAAYTLSRAESMYRVELL